MNIFNKLTEFASTKVHVIETTGNKLDELLCPEVVIPGNYFNCELYLHFGGGPSESVNVIMFDEEKNEEEDSTKYMVIPGIKLFYRVSVLEMDFFRRLEMIAKHNI